MYKGEETYGLPAELVERVLREERGGVAEEGAGFLVGGWRGRGCGRGGRWRAVGWRHLVVVMETGDLMVLQRWWWCNTAVRNRVSRGE